MAPDRINRAIPRWERAFALLATLLLLTLLLAITAQLTTSTACESLVAARRHRTLDHDLAVESALLLVVRRLQASIGLESTLVRDLDNRGAAECSFEIGDLKVHCVIRDDGAKFNPNIFQRPELRARLERTLATLGARLTLPALGVALRPLALDASSPSGYRWFDQVFGDVPPGAFFRLDQRDPERVWSDALTFWGDGRVALRRTSVDLLDAALEDVRPGLGRTLLASRPADRGRDFLERALIDVPAELRERVTARVQFDSRRYALDVETALGGDRRRSYLVAHIDAGKATLLHRSAITW